MMRAGVIAATLLAFPACAQHRGGDLRLLAHASAGTIDPQINYTAQFWQLFLPVYDGLVAYRKVAGPAGTDIVPDLADAVPVPDEGGRRYVFHLRPGLRFSDGRPVRASDAAASLRRLFRVSSPTSGTFYAAIKGAEACLADPATCTLPGAVADDTAGTLTLRLSRPDPELMLKLALPHASVLPADAPDHDAGTTPLIGTGPYRIAEYDPGARLRLVRNNLFQPWNTDAQPDGYPDTITYEFGLDEEAQVTRVENGQADWMFDLPPADRLAELGTRYAQGVHLSPAFALSFLPMNVNLPPFNDVRVRRAVNMAVNREEAVRLFGGPRMAQPQCQVLPPGLPGSAPYCPYPTDLAQARRLVAEAGAVGQTVTLVADDSGISRALGTLMLDTLRDLGFDARLRTLSAAIQFPYIQNTRNRVQISLTSWTADYPSASDFLPVNFGCAAFHAGSDTSVNIPGICDPAIEAANRAALEAAPADAPRLWEAADRVVTDLAPSVVLFTPQAINVMAPRVGHVVLHPQFGWLLQQAWVQ